ncbi:MAG: 30S ribosomal protein S20 [Phycisphaerae bacterium]|nr:30S ribosomal protein S20 [Phycisphaerae bacterium]OUX02638.1 MAG: 30S ribosomal protein S20 [Phycisphaeraceae bacterium TMED231]
MRNPPPIDGNRGCIPPVVRDNGRFASPQETGLVPNTESAKKRVRQSAKRRALNNWRKRRVKNQIKSFLSAVQHKDVGNAESEFRKVCSVLDKVACTPAMHRNTAARRKSRLSRRLRDLKAAAA